MMVPADIGLPEKFSKFYPDQLETAIQVGASDKRFFIDAAPTGFGKSLMYMAVAKLLDARTVVLTANKGLQQQLSRDFTPIGLTDIRGQANYPCQALISIGKVGLGCDKGPCHSGVQCELHPRFGGIAGCDWFDALAAARKSRLLVTNYDFWMAANRYMEPGILGAFDLIILDEAHDAPDKLADFCAVRLENDECEEWLETGLPPIEDGADAWADWATKHLPTLESWVDESKSWAMKDPDRAKRVRDLAGRVGFLSTCRTWQRSEPSEPTIVMPGISNDWVAERTEDGGGATFSPVWAHRYAERFLFTGIKKVMLVSATILPITAGYLGVPEAESEFKEHESGFSPERRPIYLLPSAHVSRGSSDADYRGLITKIDQIIEGRKDRRGLILTTSYKLAEFITWNSKNKRSMISCENKKTRFGWRRRPAREAVDQFKVSPVGSILVGPAFDTGFDFPYEECEYIIIAKVPFLDTRPLVMKARVKSDKKFAVYMAALRLVQSAGRGMRAADDRCETFILDSNIGWFYPAAKKMKMLPRWFMKAVKWVDSLPATQPKISRLTH